LELDKISSVLVTRTRARFQLSANPLGAGQSKAKMVERSTKSGMGRTGESPGFSFFLFLSFRLTSVVAKSYDPGRKLRADVQ